MAVWVSRVSKAVTGVLEPIVGAVFLALLVLVAVMVIQRYVFGTGILGGDELIEYLFIYTSTIGGAVVLGRREHVSIPVFWKRMRPWIRKTFDTTIHLVIIVLNAYMIMLSRTWIAGVGGSPSTMLHIPMWVVEIGLPIGCGLTILYCLFNTLQPLPSGHAVDGGAS